VDAERQHYETIRLLYVAVTRARERLHLFGRFKFSPKKGCYADSDSFLQMLAAAFEPAFTARDYRAETARPCEPEPVALPLLRLVNAPEINLEPPEFPHAVAAGPPALPDRDAVALGQALHWWLELMHDHWEREWSMAWFDERPAMLESLLQRAGAHRGSVGRLLPRLRSMIRMALEQDCGRRAFSPHGASESHAEFTLFKREGKRIAQRIIDRLYRDQAGRWHIVDYKTGASGEDRQVQWKAQLSAYAGMVRSITGADLPACQVYQAEECRIIPLTPVSASGSVGGEQGVPA